MNPIAFVRNGLDAARRALVFMVCGYVPPPLVTSLAAPNAADPSADTGDDADDSEDGCDSLASEPVLVIRRIKVCGRYITAATNRLTPGEILRAAGNVPASGCDWGPVLVRLAGRSREPADVYGPADEHVPLRVYDGTTFDLWEYDDVRLFWYAIDGVRHVTLDFAVAPAELLRRAGRDPNDNTLHHACDGRIVPMPPDQTKPVRVQDGHFMVVPRAQSESLVRSDMVENMRSPTVTEGASEKHDSQD